MKNIYSTTFLFKVDQLVHQLFKIAFILVLASHLTGCAKNETPVVVEAPPEVPDTDTTALARKLMKSTGIQIISKFKNDKFTEIANGLTLTQFAFLNKLGLPVNMFILEADLKNPKLTAQALLPYNDYLNGLQKLSEMSKDNQKAGGKIMAAINGDFWTGIGNPDGYFYIDGFALKTTRTTLSRAYFAIMKDKTPLIGGLDPTGKEIPGITLTNIQQAVSGRQWLVFNGALVPTIESSPTARTGIGYTVGNVVYTIVVDGAQEDYSEGLSLDDLAKFMVALGTTRAINLTGGANSTVVLKNGAENKWLMKNQQPKGAEAIIANGIGFMVAD